MDSSNKKKELSEGEIKKLEIFGYNCAQSGAYSWLYYNDYLRRVIVASISAKGLTRVSIAKQIRVKPQNLSSYLNRNFKVSKAISDFSILKICEHLGIDIGLEIKKAI